MSTFLPLMSTCRNLRRRLVIAHFSTRLSLRHEPSFCGARPQYTAAGMRSMSSVSLACRISIIRTSCAGGRRSRGSAPKHPRGRKEKKEGARPARLLRQALARARELQAYAGALQDGKIGEAAALEHVA